MPPHIQPKSLQATVLVNVLNLIIESCVNIQLQLDSFDHYLCQQAVRDLQNYLLPKVRPFLDCICDTVNHDDLCRLDDKRIFYSLVVHRTTKLLNLNSFYNRRSGDYECYQMFCIDHISKLENLVSLHLCQNTVSVQVIKTIADTCYMSLQEITITPLLTEFSDELLYLSKCKELRYLKILSFSPKDPPDDSLKKLTLLIKSLPKLEFFDSGDMIKILSAVEVTNRLSLTKLKEIDTNVHDISHVIKICPKLVDMDIAVVSSYSYESETVLQAIASSSLLLTSLTLRGFVCQKQVDHLFATKGASLRNIRIAYPFHVVNSINVYTIGKYCPNLKTLDLDFPEESFDYRVAEAGAVTVPVFTKLESLCFGWYKVESNGQSILPLILGDANQISVLKLQCSTSRGSQDALNELLCSNTLIMLTELSLIVNGPGTLSQQSMSCLIDCCPKLRECYMFGHIRRESHYFLQKLYGRIQDENLDLQFDVFER